MKIFNRKNNETSGFAYNGKENKQSFLDKFFNGEIEENRNTDGGYVPPISLSYGGFSIANGAMNLAAAYRSVELISDSIASLPIKIKEINGNGKNNELIENPLNLLFNNKKNNQLLSKYNLIKLLIQNVILRGNGFAYIKRGVGNIPTDLIFLSNDDVTINYDKYNNKVTYTCSLISNSPINDEDMIHLVKNTYDGVNGVSVLTFANRSIGLSNNTENAASDFFKNGGNVTGVLKVNTNLSKEQRLQILNDWNASFANSNKGLAVIQGNMDFTKLSITAEESQMLQTRQYNTQDICRFFGVNPILLGIKDGSNFSSLEQIQNEFLQFTLMPYITMVEEEFKRKLISEDEDIKIILDTNSILRVTKQEQANYYSTLVNNGIMTVNECRRELGLATIDGADKLTMAYTDITQNVIADADNNNNELKSNKNDKRSRNTSKSSKR